MGAGKSIRSYWNTMRSDAPMAWHQRTLYQYERINLQAVLAATIAIVCVTDKEGNMASVTFAHMRLSCEDPIAVERFYTKYFGFKRTRVIPVGDDERIVFIKSGNLGLEIFKARGEAPTPPASGAGPEYPGWRHIAFLVDGVDAKLAEMGDDAKITLGPLDFDEVIPGWRTVWIADPEGNIIEITQEYVDQENPPPLERKIL